MDDISPGHAVDHRTSLLKCSIRGIFVGNKTMAQDLAAAIDVSKIKPVIDKVFAFEDAAEAYRYQATGAFGKVVIKV